MDERTSTRYQRYLSSRKRFSIIVYIITIIVILLTFGQWMLALLIDDIGEFFEDQHIIALGCLFAELLLLTFFIFFEKLRFIKVLNWIFAIIIILLLTWGLVTIMLGKSIEMHGVTFGIAIVLLIVGIIIGCVMKHDFTLDVIILFVLSLLCFLSSVFFVMLNLYTEYPWAITVYAGMAAVIVFMFIIYHSQTVRGGRYAEMRTKDTLLASLIFYHDFVILYMIALYFVNTFLADKLG